MQSGERIGGNQDWKQKTRWKADAVLLGRDNDDYAKGVAVWIGRSSENWWCGLIGFGGRYVGRGETKKAKDVDGLYKQCTIHGIKIPVEK